MEQEKELHGFFSEFGKENGIVISPRLYADQKEKICITFFPSKTYEIIFGVGRLDLLSFHIAYLLG